jgi:hypothetical protein
LNYLKSTELLTLNDSTWEVQHFNVNKNNILSLNNYNYIISRSLNFFYAPMIKLIILNLYLLKVLFNRAFIIELLLIEWEFYLIQLIQKVWLFPTLSQTRIKDWFKLIIIFNSKKYLINYLIQRKFKAYSHDFFY